jgi:hypothetical protein
MNKLFEWLTKFFGHIPVEGLDALLFKNIQLQE